MSLEEIYKNICRIATDMGYGNITYRKKKFKRTARLGTPESILTSIISVLSDDVKFRRTPEKETVESVLNALIQFKKVSDVEELGKPISDLTDYLVQMNNE